jgi:hypothetical protein
VGRVARADLGGLCARAGDRRDHEAPAGAFLFDDVGAGTVARKRHVPEMSGHGLLGWVSYGESIWIKDKTEDKELIRGWSILD